MSSGRRALSIQGLGFHGVHPKTFLTNSGNVGHAAGAAPACFGLPVRETLAQSIAVNLSTYLQMDPHLLVGLINTELRNHCHSLEDLVKTHYLDEESLIEKLGKAGYISQSAQNQFR